MSAGARVMFWPVGFTTSSTPQKAAATAPSWKGVSFSFKRSALSTMAKKGLILLSMEASASSRWSTA